MPPRRFKDMTAEERREVRKQQRINKRKKKASPSNVVRRARETAPPVNPAAPKPAFNFADAVQRAKAEETGTPESVDFQEMFLDIVQFLPSGEQRDQAFSMFSVFRSLPPNQQADIVDSLADQAKQAVGPEFDKEIDRLKEDANFQRASLERSKSFAKATFDRLKSDLDFNALRDKAKVNKALASTVRRVTSKSFVTGVKGTSGLLRRRTRDSFSSAAETRDDIEIKKKQQIQNAQLALNKAQEAADAQLTRTDVLEQRGVDDLLEDQKEEERSLFLDLFTNQNEILSDQALDNIATGAIADQPLADRVRTTGEDAVSSIAGERTVGRQLTKEKEFKKKIADFDAQTLAMRKSLEQDPTLDASVIPNMLANREFERSKLEYEANTAGVTPGQSQVAALQTLISGKGPSSLSTRRAQELSGTGVPRVGNTNLPTASAPANSSLDLARQLASGAISAADFQQRRNALMMGGGQIAVDTGSFGGTGRFAGQSDTSGGRGLSRITASRLRRPAPAAPSRSPVPRSAPRTTASGRITARSSGGTIKSRAAARGAARS